MAIKESSLGFLRYFATVFDNIQDAILLIGVEPDGNFRLIMGNAGFFQGTGHSKDDVGKLVQDVVTPQAYDGLVKKYRQVAVTKKPLEYADWFEVPLGRQAYEVKLIPILNTVGECVQI